MRLVALLDTLSPLSLLRLALPWVPLGRTLSFSESGLGPAPWVWQKGFRGGVQ